MTVLVRILKSARNRARLLGMLARGAAARASMPGILKGGTGLLVGKNVAFVIYGELIVGAAVTLSDGCAIEVGPRGRLVLGDRVFIGRHSVISSQQSVEIGSRTLIGEHSTIRDQDHHLDPEERLREISAIKDPVVISKNVWIAAGVRVLKGSRIGEGAVVAANAVVRGEVPAGVLAAGIPARVVRTIKDAREKAGP